MLSIRPYTVQCLSIDTAMPISCNNFRAHIESMHVNSQSHYSRKPQASSPESTSVSLASNTMDTLFVNENLGFLIIWTIIHHDSTKMSTTYETCGSWLTNKHLLQVYTHTHIHTHTERSAASHHSLYDLFWGVRCSGVECWVYFNAIVVCVFLSQIPW